MNLDALVVGMGFAGATCARVLADAGLRVHLVDRRSRPGGNACEITDSHGVIVHPYGPHIFHTNSRRIFDFLSRFTEWRPYEHRVRALVDGRLLPVPINRTTINGLYGLRLDEDGVAAFLAAVREPRDRADSSEDVVLGTVGRDLCEKFYRGYSRKQWGLDLSELSPGVCARLPVRTNDDDRYHQDAYQSMPTDGYAVLFHNMLAHPLITWETGVDFERVRGTLRHRHLVYTGPIDAYFDFRHGRLPYRSIEFRHRHVPGVGRLHDVATVNFPGDVDYTRETEFKHVTGQVHSGTSIVREYPRAEGEPLYPIPTRANEALFKLYQADAAACSGVTFVGRLAQYRYYNMDQVVGAALAAAASIARQLGAN